MNDKIVIGSKVKISYVVDGNVIEDEYFIEGKGIDQATLSVIHRESFNLYHEKSSMRQVIWNDMPVLQVWKLDNKVRIGTVHPTSSKWSWEDLTRW